METGWTASFEVYRAGDENGPNFKSQFATECGRYLRQKRLIEGLNELHTFFGKTSI